MTPTYTDGPVDVYVGSALAVLGQMPDESVHCVVTSPPYWGQRDYGTSAWEGGDDPACDHSLPDRENDAGGQLEERIRLAEANKAKVHMLNGGVCRRCVARRLEPTIWGGADGCEHEWGDAVKIGDPNRGNAGTTLSGSTRNQEAGNRWRGTSSFCQLCGAWRGALGHEPTPQMYVDHLEEIFREVRRVLRRDGTLWLNLGDSYCFDIKGGGGGHEKSGLRAGGRSEASRLQAAARTIEHQRMDPRRFDHGLKPKDLVGIPWRVAFALQADGWWLRSDNIWSKPNAMPESVRDRTTSTHEYLFLLTKSERYFYDDVAVREPAIGTTHRDLTGTGYSAPGQPPQTGNRHRDLRPEPTPSRNKRSVWTIATQPYAEAHFAAFPEKLVEPCVLAGTSERGCCPECSSPWRRVEGRALVNTDGWGKAAKDHHDTIHGPAAVIRNGQGRAGDSEVRTTGWEPTCQHGHNPIPCVVLDPFAGSGTALAVARGLGRRSIGIELNPKYLTLIRQRVSGSALPLLEMVGE